MLNNTLYSSYLKACFLFAEDSKEWIEFNKYMFYTTNHSSGYEETSDNAHGGYDVTWAFHMSVEEIVKDCAVHYYEQILDKYEVTIEAFEDDEEKYRKSEIRKYLKQFKNEVLSIPVCYLVATGSEYAEELGVDSSRIRQIGKDLEREMKGRKAKGSWLVNRM